MSHRRRIGRVAHRNMYGVRQLAQRVGRMTSLRKRACIVCAKPTFVSINP